MGGSEEGVAAGAAYAAALRDVVDGFLATGGTQKQLATALYISPAALSRYLSGDRVASYDFLRKLRAFLEERGLLWDQETGDLLDALCSQAHATSGSPAVQLVQIREELDRLRGEQQHAKRVADTRLADLETQARDLAAQLAQALDHARTSEGARALLQEQVREQDESLRHAQDYIHQIEADLSGQREQARLLQQEVGVLRAQNQRLVEEQTQAVSGVSTQDTTLEPAVAPPRDRPAEISPGPTAVPLWSSPERNNPSAPASPDPYAHPARPAQAQGASRRYADTAGPDRILAVGVPLVTYASFVLLTAFIAGLEADPGPSIWKMLLAGGTALLWPASSVGVLRLGLPRGDARAKGLVVGTFWGQLMALSIWFAFPSTINPVLSVMGLDASGQWLADVAGLL
ncbi:helix-turn-helix domain-containing protein (plasmid) [Streptomyces clavifer]|uniref:helix-turn-helix domain-containing protein n=1 Tax=Streptomyces clavifer TaxID=68188 RepID=UPI002E7FB525|nr:helix-turn-helix domain-containing protein [Streptomyces clavifer]WUC32722.1 helix-turn-helix domain-containing protein [Streptomyces clavifer]